MNLELDLTGREWTALAACKDEDPDLFFPTEGDPAHRAHEMCARCPVRVVCLEYALEHGERGIWGGTGERQRRRIRAYRAREAAKAS